MAVIRAKREPDFANLACVLRREVPSRPTLFEFYTNETLNKRLAGLPEDYHPKDLKEEAYMQIRAYENAGYDYCTVRPTTFYFPRGDRGDKATVSLNTGSMITDRADFEAYPWPDADAVDYSFFDEAAERLPGGMKLIPYGPDGILENVTALVGYDNMCFMLYEDPELLQNIFDRVGGEMLKYYQHVAVFESVGAIISNDDWGFNTQTMLAPDDLRRYVFPWHKRIVEAAHAAGKYAILHSCGYPFAIMDDIIEDMKFDGKHSYEDTIQPVEEAYEQYGNRIAILGGIDVNFLCSAESEAIAARCRAMLARSAQRGGYALGSGNSIPEYVPIDHYMAMISAVFDA